MRVVEQADCCHARISALQPFWTDAFACEIRQTSKTFTQHSLAACLKLTPLQASHLTRPVRFTAILDTRPPEVTPSLADRLSRGQFKPRSGALNPQLCSSYVPWCALS